MLAVIAAYEPEPLVDPRGNTIGEGNPEAPPEPEPDTKGESLLPARLDSGRVGGVGGAVMGKQGVAAPLAPAAATPCAATSVPVDADRVRLRFSLSASFVCTSRCALKRGSNIGT